MRQWPRARGSGCVGLCYIECVRVCEPLGLVFIWCLCHQGGEEWRRWRREGKPTLTGSDKHTHTQTNTHSLCAINPPHSDPITPPPSAPFSSSTLFCNLPSEPLEYPEEMTFQLKRDLQGGVGFFFLFLFFISDSSGVLDSNNLNWNWFFNLPTDCYWHGNKKIHIRLRNIRGNNNATCLNVSLFNSKGVEHQAGHWRLRQQRLIRLLLTLSTATGLVFFYSLIFFSLIWTTTRRVHRHKHEENIENPIQEQQRRSSKQIFLL